MLLPAQHFSWCTLHISEISIRCVFVICDFCYVEVGPLYTYVLESFYHKWMLKFVKSFFCIYWDDCMVFTSQFFNRVCHIDYFANIEKSLHPLPQIIQLDRDVWFFFMYCCNWFACILMRIFTSVFFSDFAVYQILTLYWIDTTKLTNFRTFYSTPSTFPEGNHALVCLTAWKSQAENKHSVEVDGHVPLKREKWSLRELH